MLLVAAVVFVYYTAWALFMPFLPPDNAFHSLFPPREWAVRIPALLVLVFFCTVAAFMGSVMMKSARTRRKGKGKGA